MDAKLSISNFESLNLADKINFFDGNWNNESLNHSGVAIQIFLKRIVLDKTENSYVRERALKGYIDAVLIQKIKIRQALALLIDDWGVNDALFLEVQRTKSLFLFYDYDPELIYNILEENTKAEEGELSAEAHYTIGLVLFQKGLINPTANTLQQYLIESKKAFSFAILSGENRLDAKVLYLTVDVIEGLLTGNSEQARLGLQEVAKLLFEKCLFEFKPSRSAIYVGFYRTLNALMKLTSETPSNWLNFRDDIGRLYYQYSLIQNEKLERRLNESNLVNSLQTTINEKIIKPFFAVNLSAEKVRIKRLQDEVDPETDEYQFLKELSELADKEDLMNNALSATLEQKLIKSFPGRTKESVRKVIANIQDINNVYQFANAYETLAIPSYDRFLDKLVTVCLTLQGNRLYWNDALEDDRNTFVASMLESAEYIVKDQTRWSSSNVGKASGEIDILIKDNFGKTFTIIEALNLDSLKKDYLELHLSKVFKYDANGCKYIYILVYSTAKQFGQFWKNYYSFISTYNYPFAFQNIEEVELGFTDIKSAQTEHLRNGKKIFLIHIALDLNKSKSRN